MHAPAIPASSDAARPTTRDPFFDAVRALALVRVVAWHTYEWAPLSYVAAMPVMFFVGGVMAQRSFTRRSPVATLRGRLRRLLPPLWAYSAFTWAALVLTGVASPHDVASPPWRALWWAVPLWDPTGPDEAVAWWAPLWYLRAYLWLLLLTPLLRGAMRRHGARRVATAAIAIAVTVALWSESGRSVAPQLEDAATYGAFWLAGMGVATRRGQSPLALRRPIAIATVAALALLGAMWMAVRDVPLGIVNASPLAEMTFGAAWVVGLCAAAPAVRRAARADHASRIVGVLNRRAMTVYLWHCAAIVLAHELLDAFDVAPRTHTVGLAALVLVGTTTFVALAGPFEDLAARRRRSHPHAHTAPTPRRRAPAVLGATALSAVAVTVLPALDLTDAEGAYVPASGRGLERLVAARPETSEPPTRTPVVRGDGPVTPDELQTVVDDWRRDWAISGVLVGVARADGTSWTGASGDDWTTEQPMDPAQVIPAHSITKSFTGALVAQLAEAGLVDLDAPLATWIPEFPHAGRITVRQLAQHTSGLVDTGLEPSQAIEKAGATPLLFEPGTDTRYADSGYFLLGELVERVTGAAYEDLVAQQLFVPLGLDVTTLHVGPRGSAGGIHTTVRDLARWAPRFWGGALGELTAAEARRIDPSNNFGIGTFGYCPCDGVGTSYVPELYGHLSSQGRLAWDPLDDLAVMIHTNEENDGGRTIDAWMDLDRRLRTLTGGRPLSPELGDATSAVPTEPLPATTPPAAVPGAAAATTTTASGS